MIIWRSKFAAVLVALQPFCSVAMAGPVFQVRSSGLEIPPGVPMGSYRRTIHPFPNWTLICDDNLAAKRRICDIRQEIEIRGAGVVFTWAVTATEKGPPVMRIRAPAGVGVGGKVTLGFADGTTYAVPMAQCGNGLCEGIVPLGPKLQAHIKDGLDINIKFNARPVGLVSFNTPMRGLTSAIKAAR